jgi:hypothetical protein
MIARIIRYFSDTLIDTDVTPSARAKVAKVEKVTHACCCITKKGTPCSKSGTVEDEGKWYCTVHASME